MTFKYSMPPHFKKPKLVTTRTKYTVADILSAIPNDTRLKSRHVEVLEAKRMKSPSILKDYTTYRLTTRNNVNQHKYRITIFSPTPYVTKATKVIIDSPNPLWVFKYEYAMAKHGNAFIYRSNGQPAIITNPRNKRGADHHVAKALRWLILNSRKVQ